MPLSSDLDFVLYNIFINDLHTHMSEVSQKEKAKYCMTSQLFVKV